MIYDGGEPISIAQGDGVWIPIKVSQSPTHDPTIPQSILPSTGGPEIVSGLWETGKAEGIILVTNLDLLDLALDQGDKVGEIPASSLRRPCAQIAEMWIQKRGALKTQAPDVWDAVERYQNQLGHVHSADRTNSKR